MTIFQAIENLCVYGIEADLLDKADKLYTRNRLLELFDLTTWEECNTTETNHFTILKEMVNYAYTHQIIESDKPPYSDLFESKVMDLLLPKPSKVIKTYHKKYLKSPREATDYYYDFSKKSHYIRLDRTSKNMVWKVPSKYGDIDITVNLSKPEKDPKAIAAAANQVESNYPKCFLCKENEGFSGHINHPGRQNHRIIPLMINNEDWFFQYSPYAYFNEHSIVFKSDHSPMVINKTTFKRLFEYVDLMPHYFIGSNADLPLVGGSMLTHDHYQSGDYTFAMEKTKALKTYGLHGVQVEHLNWPLSVLRLTHDHLESILDLSDKIFTSWVSYSDSSLNIQAYTDDIRHNTVTPIVRKVNNQYQIDLVLRNNRCDDSHPTGIFHPGPDVHPVKKENIGLIEVMGLAVLPSRLKTEMVEMTHCVYNNQALPLHLKPFEKILDAVTKKDSYEEVYDNLLQVVGLTFVKGLEDAGVFKLDKEGLEGLERFINQL